jgi:hypothetical protein
MHALYNFQAAGIEVTVSNGSMSILHECAVSKPSFNSQATVWCFKCYPLLRNISCLATCYLAKTRPLSFVVTGTWFPIRCSAMDVCSAFTIPAISRHVTIFRSFKWSLLLRFTGQNFVHISHFLHNCSWPVFLILLHTIILILFLIPSSSSSFFYLDALLSDLFPFRADTKIMNLEVSR